MLKAFAILAFTVVSVSAKADLIVRDTISNNEVQVDHLLSFSTSDNPVIALRESIKNPGENRIQFLELTAESLKKSGISKKDLLEMINDGLKNKTHDYRLIVRQDEHTTHRKDLIGITVLTKIK